jgi:hypothetical protein
MRGMHGAAKPHLLVRQIQPFHLHVRRFASHCGMVRLSRTVHGAANDLRPSPKGLALGQAPKALVLRGKAAQQLHVSLRDTWS